MSRIDDKTMIEMLEAGHSQRQVARHFGVTEAAVSKRKKTLGIHIAKNVTLEKAGELVEEKMDSLAQLRRINNAINGELEWALDEAKEGDRRGFQEIIVKLTAEVRQQLSLQLQIFRTLYDIEAMREFQREVLAAIGEVDPNTRERIIESLRQAGALRRATALPG